MSSPRIQAATALAPAIWGTTYLTTTQLLPAERPLLAAVLRALPAGLVLIAITRRLPDGIWWWRTFVLGALNIGAFFALLFVAAYRLPGGVVATIIAAQPLLVAGLSIWLLSERASARLVLAAVAGVTGVGLLVLPAGTMLDAAGVAAAVGAAAVFATGIVLSKRWPSPAPLLATTGWQLAAGGLLALPFALVLEGFPASLSIANLAGYAYLTIFGAAVAYALWFRGIRALPPRRVTFLALLSPVVATALDWIVRAQRLTPLPRRPRCARRSQPAERSCSTPSWQLPRPMAPSEPTPRLPTRDSGRACAHCSATSFERWRAAGPSARLRAKQLDILQNAAH